MLTVVIQAGGESRRMGRDKALAPFLEQTLIERVYQRVQDLANEVVVTTNNPDAFEGLGIRLAVDKIPGRGALGGLFTALEAATYPNVAVIACDMPFVSPELLYYQMELLGSENCDAVVPKATSGSEPFHAVYRRATCLQAVQQALQAGRWRVDSWFGNVSVVYVNPAVVHRYDPHQVAFWNVNTLDELHRAEELAKVLDCQIG